MEQIQARDLVRAKDWGQTALGPPSTWSPVIRAQLQVALASRCPTVVFCGPECRLIYNEPYAAILGPNKHPRALGARADEVWSEAWDSIQPLLEAGLAGRAVAAEQVRLHIVRDERKVECHFSCFYTPLVDDDQQVQGVLCSLIETTREIIGARRLQALRELALSRQEAEALVVEDAVRTLDRYRSDVPFSLVYLTDDNGRHLRLVGSSGVSSGSSWVPTHVDLTDGSCQWPFSAVIKSKTVAVAHRSTIGWWVPAGDSPEFARVVPLSASDGLHPAGLLVLGVSPCIRQDAEYRAFFDLIAGQFGSLLMTARAREGDRRRARALAELDRAKTTFFGNVSHEFRTPLTLILGPVEDSLRDSRDPLSPAQRARQEGVHRNALRLLKLVNSLLDFSQVEVARVAPRLEPTDVGTLTAAIASAFRPLVERAGIALSIDCPPVAAPILIDRQSWEKIVLNLVSNAFKYTFSGEISVRVECDAAQLRLVVNDTGTGIEARHLPRIFERFYRVENTRGRTYDGSGIGLALVQELVRLQGGTIEVQSEVGVGSTFTVTIPRADHEARGEFGQLALPLHTTSNSVRLFVAEAATLVEEAATLSEAGLSEVENPGTKNDFHVLVADDDPDMCRYLEVLLAPIASVEVVNDGATALDAIARRQPDLFLCDVWMPRIDGSAVVAAIRQNRTLRNMPIVMLSARSSDDARIEGVSAGADDYIVKPFSGRELVARVRAQLQLAAQRRALATSADEFRAAFDASSVGMCQTDPSNGRLLRANKRFCSMLGYSEDELVAVPLADFTHPEDRQGHISAQERLVAGESSELRLEERYRRKDGAIVWTDITMNLVHDVSGQPLRTVAMVQDITERKERESSYHRWLIERAQWKAERRIVEELRTVDRRKSEFIGVLSHELRNPLAAIRSSLYLIEHSASGSTTAVDAAAVIGRQVTLLARMVDDLLDVTRISQNKIQLRSCRVELNALVLRSLGDYDHLFADNGVHLSTDLCRQPICIDADAARMQQVLTNLTWNAMKFTPRGGQVNISTRIEGSLAVLRVRDTGVGIEPTTLKRLFEPFMQADRTLDRSRGGLGLGLALVKGLVELHGGSVTASSDGAGKGAEFTVSLPLAEGGGAHPDPDVRLGQSRRRILLVDDEADVRDPLAAALLLLGHEVESAADGPAAIVAAHAFKPDTILCDIGLPGMDGYGVARALRADSSLQSAMLVALSGYAQSDDIARARAAGFDLHLTKPISPEAIGQAIAANAPVRLVQKLDHSEIRILVVDDEPALRMAISDLLREAGYQVLVAATTCAALDLVARQAETIDLLLTDLSLPTEGGERLAEALRERHPQLRVVYMSGAPEAPAGAAFLQKPFDFDQLQRLVEKVLCCPARSTLCG